MVPTVKSPDHTTFDLLDIDSYTESIRKDLRTVRLVLHTLKPAGPGGFLDEVTSALLTVLLLLDCATYP